MIEKKGDPVFIPEEKKIDIEIVAVVAGLAALVAGLALLILVDQNSTIEI